MKIVILGPPGAGKGTCASRIAEKLGISHIATGDILRQAVAKKTPKGIEADKYMKEGEPVPDKIMTKIIIDHISRPEHKDGFIFDTPYNEEQAKDIDEIAKIDIAINILIPEYAIIERLSTRRLCKECGEIYNIKTLKPKVEGKCDKCGGELYQRKDDSPEAIKERIRIYEKRAGPLIDYYRKRGVLVEVECTEPDAPPEVMVNKVLKLLEEKN